MINKFVMIVLLLTATLVPQTMAASTKAALNVLTCEPEWMSLVKEIGGDKVIAHSATTGLQDPHHIEARPSLLAKARRAQLLICTGADLEIGWLPLLVRKSGNKNIQSTANGYFMATDYALLLEKPQSLDRSQGDIHAPGNPHIQMDPERILDVAEALSERLQLLDAANADYYQTNYEQFSKRWSEAIDIWKQKAMALKGMRIITHHRNWIYLQQWLGLTLVATIESKPGVPPSSNYLAKLVRRAKNSNTMVIIHAAHSNPKASNWLAKRSDIPVVSLPYTVGGTAAATDLFSLFDETLTLLLEVTNGD